MDITDDTLARLGAKLDACDLTDDEHAALVGLLTHRPSSGDDPEVTGFAKDVRDSHDRYANQEVSYVRSITFGELLPKLVR